MVGGQKLFLSENIFSSKINIRILSKKQYKVWTAEYFFEETSNSKWLIDNNLSDYIP